MHTATVICSRNGRVVATYHFPYPEALDDSRVARPDRQGLVDDAKLNLHQERLATPLEWNDIKFEVTYSR